ncbi:MAG: methenyltetrahydromethanopterin cyclohydrolase [Gammaproteobacteria bacterium]
MHKSKSAGSLGINVLANERVARLLAGQQAYRLAVEKQTGGATLIDAGINAPGGLEAGRQIAEICLGGLGRVNFRAANDSDGWNWYVDVHSNHPVMACLASQYAGWSLSHGEGKQAFQALGSGPGRVVGSKEPLFEELGYREQADKTCLILEVDSLPPAAIAEQVAEKCGIRPEQLTLILTPTSSLAGVVQIVARVLETALHKAHELHFPLDKIVDGLGSAPLCPPAADFLTAMSRTNDAILFAGQVQLFVAAGDDECEQLAAQLPSSASADYGKPFGEVFKAVEYDFYKIDPLLFSPASVTVSSLQTGRSFHSGAIDRELLNQSFSRTFS